TRIDDIGITRDIEKDEVTVNEYLGAHDPEADRRQVQHDGVVNGDPETDRHQIEKNVQWLRHISETGERNDNHHPAERGVNHAVEPELLRRKGEFAVDRKQQQG